MRLGSSDAVGRESLILEMVDEKLLTVLALTQYFMHR